MADLPYPGGFGTVGYQVAVCPVRASPSVVLPDDRLLFGAGIDNSIGNPAPSYKISGIGKLHFRLGVAAGVRQISVSVLQPTATAVRAFVQVLPNPAIGVNVAVVTSASASTNWQQVVVTFTATANGAVVLELWNNDAGSPCWFDNVLST